MSTRTSWRLLIAENLITTSLVVPILTVFSLSLGLTLSDVGVIDIVSSSIYLVLNIPAGWAADRLSRKICNFLGDAIYGISLVTLGMSTSLSGVITAYVIMALGAVCSQGADVALHEAHCDELEINYEEASKRLSQARTCIGMLACLGCSILVAHYDMKTAILIASLPYFIGAVLSCFVQEIGVRKEIASLGKRSLQDRARTEFKVMTGGVKYVLVKNRRLTGLSWLIITCSVGKAMSGPVLLFVGPMLLLIGGRESDVALTYVILGVMALIGGEVSRRGFKTTDISTQFIWACVLALVAMGVLSLHLSIWTVGVFLVVHIVRGWIFTAMPPLIQKETPQDLKATISSLSATLSQLLGVIVVFVITHVGDNYGVSWGFAVNVAIFIPLVTITAWRLRRTTPRKQHNSVVQDIAVV